MTPFLIYPNSTLRERLESMKGNVLKLMTIAAVCFVSLIVTEHRVFAAADEPVTEAQLIAILKSDAAWEPKYTACTTLRRIGTAASVPALASLLGDEKLSHMALYALEPMPYAEAGKALRDALSTTSGMQRLGIVVSLGARRDAEAAALIAPLLKDSDGDTARAAAGALGRIATDESVKALRRLDKTAPDALKNAADEGLLAAGHRFAEAKRNAAALAIYGKLLAPTKPMMIRMGAFRGLIDAQPARAPKRLVKALRGGNDAFRDMSAQIVAETSGAEQTAFYAKTLPSLPSGGKVALLRGLASRKDSVARPAVVKALSDNDKQIKLAATRALGSLGNAEDVPSLVSMLASDDADIASAARMTLAMMQAEGVNAAIAAAGATVNVKEQIAKLLTDRRAEQALPLAVQSVADSDSSIRIAGLNALAQLASTEHVPLLIAALAKATDANERSAAGDALTAVASRGGEEALPVIMSAMSSASVESRILMLRALSQIGGGKVFDAILSTVGDANEQISDEAVRLLSNWPGQEAAPHLLELAKSEKANRHDLGLRGYVRLARENQSGESKASMLTTAMGLNRRTEEKWLVLSAWGTLPTKQSLDVLLPNLDDASVKNEAASAIIAVASEMGKSDEGKPLAVQALKDVLAKCDDAGIRDRAQKALARITG